MGRDVDENRSSVLVSGRSTPSAVCQISITCEAGWAPEIVANPWKTATFFAKCRQPIPDPLAIQFVV